MVVELPSCFPGWKLVTNNASFGEGLRSTISSKADVHKPARFVSRLIHAAQSAFFIGKLVHRS